MHLTFSFPQWFFFFFFRELNRNDMEWHGLWSRDQESWASFSLFNLTHGAHRSGASSYGWCWRILITFNRIIGSVSVDGACRGWRWEMRIISWHYQALVKEKKGENHCVRKNIKTNDFKWFSWALQMSREAVWRTVLVLMANFISAY